MQEVTSCFVFSDSSVPVPCPQCSLVAALMLFVKYCSHTQSALHACCNYCTIKGKNTVSAYSEKVLVEVAQQLLHSVLYFRASSVLLEFSQKRDFCLSQKLPKSFNEGENTDFHERKMLQDRLYLGFLCKGVQEEMLNSQILRCL